MIISLHENRKLSDVIVLERSAKTGVMKCIYLF